MIVLWLSVAALSAAFGYWLGEMLAENEQLREQNQQLRARLAAHEAPTDYLKGESE